MRRLNVVHICDKFGVRGSAAHGVSRLFAWWLPRFDFGRFNVKLYALKRPDAASRALEAEGVPMSYLGRSALNPFTLAAFLGVIRRERADVLHLHGWIAANYGRIAGRMAKVPTIMHEHGVDPQFPVTQRIADRLLSSLTHTALAVSKSVRDFLIAHRSVNPSRIRIIYNGAPLNEFAPAPPELVAQVRKELSIPPGSRVVGSIGRLDIQKGITHLIQAACRVVREVPDVQFLIVGDGPERGKLTREAEGLGLAGNIIFAGYRTDIPVIQTMLDVQAFPSLWEGTPLTAFEAMAMGRAIVSTDVDGLGEVLSDGRSALLVRPADPDQLAEGIIRVFSDGGLADKLRAGARAQSGNFDISQTVRNMESLYEELCAGR